MAFDNKSILLSNELPIKTLSSLTISLKNGLSSYYLNNGDVSIRLVNMKDVQNGKVNVDSVESIKVKETEALVKNRLSVGDLLVTAKGQVFKAAVAGKELEGFVISANLIALTLNGEVDSEIVAAYLNSPSGQRALVAKAAGGSIKGLNAKTLLEVPVPVPAKEKQQALRQYLSIVNEYNDIVERERKLMNGIRDSIMREIIG
jgi:restriction endonuclease S subunit